jgi:2-phosphoglycerate kinase
VKVSQPAFASKVKLSESSEFCSKLAVMSLIAADHVMETMRNTMKREVLDLLSAEGITNKIASP